MNYEEKLKQYISENNIAAEHMHFSNSVHSVAEAAREANASAEDFVKSICMIAGDKAIIAIVLGTDKASLEKVQQLLRTSKPHIASPQEALEYTGYPVGGTPPFGYPAIFLMDENVLQKELVYAGGGSPNALIRISPKEIIRINRAQAADIRK